ncbi:ATP-binding protein [Tellurirhabdus rosea]|uniref:ATP-binding protein n=1 Tax=Tellurirhabdus rosea TaxID=2674997 RepID=UPI002255D108|nr:ATP-binding protein [Tellurirhabdus rosea]
MNSASEQFFQRIVDHMPVGLVLFRCIQNAEGRVDDFSYQFVNKTYARLTGRSAGEVSGHRLSEVFPLAVETGFLDRLGYVWETGEPMQYEEELHEVEAGRWIMVNLSRQDEGVLFTFEDITQTRFLQHEERRRREQLEGILDGCQAALMLAEALRDETGRIVDFRNLTQNEANRQLAGGMSGDHHTQTLLEVLPGLKESGIFERYTEVVETGVPTRFEHVFDQNGESRCYDVSVVRQGDGVVVSVIDETPLRQALVRSRELVAELRESNQALEQFAYVASHDLQEPLRKIQSFSTLLREQFSHSLPADAADLLRRMEAAGGRMQTLVRGLLSYSRLTTGQPAFEMVSLAKILTEIQQDLEMMVREKNATIQLSPLPILKGNPLQLRQLFQNLISNALKFTPKHLKPIVIIKGEIIDKTAVPIAASAHASWVRVEVTDNGIGIDEKHYKRIFQLFERLHGRSQYEGTGIGLAMCKKIAELHGGSISVRSKVGEGTTFTVYLPG